jgi:type I restriction enzyme M protein
MSIVRLIVGIIEPFHGRIFDPACGSGGMFVQSAHFVERHRRSPGDELSIYGQEKTGETVRLAKMNLAIHGLSGEIREGNSYYEDLHKSLGRFDFVMANPPFNVDRVDKAKLEDDCRFPDLPRADNANYLWIQLFATAPNDTGRAGFVMANSSSDARHSEGYIRRKLIQDRLVDVMVAIGSNFFYTVTLPVTLWFLDRGKRETERADRVLFIDAREVFRQIDRAHRGSTAASSACSSSTGSTPRPPPPRPSSTTRSHCGSHRCSAPLRSSSCAAAAATRSSCASRADKIPRGDASVSRRGGAAARRCRARACAGPCR